MTVLAAGIAGCSWGQAGFDAQRAGWSRADGSFTTANVGSVTLAWQADGLAPTGSGSSSAPVMDGEHVFFVSGEATGPSQLEAFAADGGPDCSGVPRSCAPLWTASIPFGASSEPIVADGRVFVGGSADGSWQLQGFDASGAAGCSGSPLVCTPVLSASVATTIAGGPPVVMAAAAGRVYLATTGLTGQGGPPSVTYVFDSAGVEGCSGSLPAECAPLFSATGGVDYAVPVIADGALYVSTATGLAAFDATGRTGCGGVPLVCLPLRRFATPRAPNSAAIADGVLYATTVDPHYSGQPYQGSVYAFDLGAVASCGAPPTCQPVWSAQSGYTELPVVADGQLYLQREGPYLSDATIDVFDARGIEGCSGVPKTCSRLAGADLPGVFHRAAATKSVIFLATQGAGIPGASRLMAFGLDDVGCNGSPAVCSPLLDLDIPQSPSSLAVAGGRIAMVVPSTTPGTAQLQVYALPA